MAPISNDTASHGDSPGTVAAFSILTVLLVLLCMGLAYVALRRYGLRREERLRAELASQGSGRHIRLASRSKRRERRTIDPIEKASRASDVASPASSANSMDKRPLRLVSPISSPPPTYARTPPVLVSRFSAYSDAPSRSTKWSRRLFTLVPPPSEASRSSRPSSRPRRPAAQAPPPLPHKDVRGRSVLQDTPRSSEDGGRVVDLDELRSTVSIASE